MEKRELEISKEELLQIKKENKEKININDERARMSKVNGLEYKGLVTLTLSFTAYVLLYIATIILTKTTGIGAITNILPGFTFDLALIGGSLGLGAIAKKILDKKYKIKERLRNFSTSKTQAEKLEEEIRYQIEVEKAKTRNRAIDATIEVLEFKHNTLRVVSRDDKHIPQTREEAEWKVQELTAIVEEKYSILDLLSTKQVLHKRFWEIRDGAQNISKSLMVIAMCGLATMILTTTPIFSSVATPDASVLVTILKLLAPCLAGGLAGGAYMVKRTKDYNKAYDRLIAQLQESTLDTEILRDSENIYSEKYTIEAMIEKQIREISLVESRLEENKRYLEWVLAQEGYSPRESKQPNTFAHVPQSEMGVQQEVTIEEQPLSKKKIRIPNKKKPNE